MSFISVEGKNSRLQGVAAAIIKLWEKSPIAKVAVKWGILNTDNEKMANELKASLKWLMYNFYGPLLCIDYTKCHGISMRSCMICRYIM